MLKIKAKKDEPKTQVFFCRKTNFQFSVPAVDPETGEKIKARNRLGELYVTVTGGFLYIMKTIKFNIVPRGNKLLPRGSEYGLSQFATSDPVYIEKLNELAKDNSTQVMTQAQYNKFRNSEAFTAQVEVEALKEEKATLQDKLEAMKIELDKAEKGGKKSDDKEPARPLNLLKD